MAETVQGTTGPIDPTSPMAFILGGGTDLTMDEIKRRRAIAMALASRNRPFPKTLGEGLTSLGEGIGDRLADARLSEQEKRLAAAVGRDTTAPIAGTVAAPPVAAPPVAAPPPVAAAPPIPPPSGPTGAFTPATVRPTPEGGRPLPSGLLDPATIGEADPGEQRNKLAALLTPEGVAQENPTAGAVQPPRGSPLASLSSLGTISDAPPVTGLPGEGNPPTPTDIAPMRVAQAGGGIPGPLTPPTPLPAPPSVGRFSTEPRLNTVPNVPPIPGQIPLSPWEIRARELQAKYPGHPHVEAVVKQLNEHGKAVREAEYNRRLEDYNKRRDLEYDQIKANQAFERTRPTTEADLREKEFKLGEAQRAAEKARRLGGVPEETWQKIMQESHKEVKNIPASTVQLANARQAIVEGKMFTGGTAEAEMAWAKFKSAIGVPPDSRIQPTEAFRAYIAPIVAQARTMLVGGANISNADLLAAERAAAGDIKLEGGSILAVLKSLENINTQMATAHHQKLLTYTGMDQDAQRAVYGAYGLPMTNIVPDDAVRMLRERTRDPANARAEMEAFDATFHTPGLAKRVLSTRRGL